MKSRSKIVISLITAVVLLMNPLMNGFNVKASSVAEKQIEKADPNKLNATELTEKKDGFISGDGEAITEIPINKKEKVLIKEESGEIGIGIPSIENETIVQEENTVFYNGSNTSIGIQALEGGARQVIILKNGNARKKYDFTYDLEDGGYLDFAKLEDGTKDGSVIIYNKEKEPIGVIGIPWARDNNGMPVKTYYEINGTTLSQIIETNEVTSYPVIADPTTYGWYFKSGKWIVRGGKRSLSLKPSLGLRVSVGTGIASIAIAQASWKNVKSNFKSSKYWKNERSIYNQYICHFYFASFKSEFNLEPYRKTVSLAKTIAKKCNP
ncbi:DUF2599 domain-containing protein [Listeria grayi]|uniref:DUF2599 domain-containing protein n=1 Tax=Listeria grayi TaxID=1641 RepID=UPI001626D6BD|nr:DUF2599 domain-containing protein [Listeria grayi]MBC1921992.1 DUF2599 domain-containing protein [Listeria grayi]